MDFNNIITFVAVATLLVISPGPNGFLIAKTVPLSGQKAGLANVAGFVGAFFIHGSLSIFGISILLVESGTAFLIFKSLGAAYLIWLGCKALKAALSPNHSSELESSPQLKKTVSIRSAFIEGLLTNTLNPKVSMFYLAAFPQFISVDDSAIGAFALVTAHALVNITWFTFMVLMLSRVKRAASSAKFKTWLNSVTGVVFIGFGAKLALTKAS